MRTALLFWCRLAAENALSFVGRLTKFPTQRNSELFSSNREFNQRNRESTSDNREPSLRLNRSAKSAITSALVHTTVYDSLAPVLYVPPLQLSHPSSGATTCPDASGWVCLVCGSAVNAARRLDLIQ